MTTKTILVTGGAGYIGSHTVLQLLDAGHNVVVLDNLYSGHRWAVPEAAQFYQDTIHNRDTVKDIIIRHQVDSVIHFAGHIVVPESVENPSKYYHNNVIGSLNLIETCTENGVGNFVFSSSAAVYGIPDHCPVDESVALSPINPYGATKLITEWTLRDLAAASAGQFNYVALRYFNVAGAHMGGLTGQATPEATHLIKVACQAACGQRDSMSVFGDDYDTHEGTCIRDYIHVDDHAAAHLYALGYLDQGDESVAVNCGYGHGYSVREVVECIKAVSGVDFTVHQQPRRAGDPPELIAVADRIRSVLGWSPEFDDLDTIVRTSLAWERRIAAGDPTAYWAA